uniref:Major facilitator superfamily (MFS) profile domain-containing protein n=1 Tax=Acrobeloides nanus TaxID=290746 RepID=A0A914ECR7_9BILA
MIELMILNQISNQLYMMYAGSAPQLISCGSHDLSHIQDTTEACLLLKTIQQNESCVPEFHVQFSSVNYEMGYYCERTKIVKYSISIQMIGLMIGAVLFGQLSDSFGRKPAMIGALICTNLFMVASSFTHSLFWFTLFRFFVNIFNAGSIAVLLIYSLEILPVKDRYWINNAVGWSPNMIVLAFMAYVSGDWKTLTRLSALLSIPAFIVCCLVDESPRYLVHIGKLAEAKAVLQRIYRIDKRKCNEDLLDFVLDKENRAYLEKHSKSKKYTFLHLFYTPDLTRYTLAIAFSFLVTSIINYALVFNIEKLAGSIYVNAILLGIVRYLSGLVISFLEVRIKCLGRKMVHFGALSTCAICAFLFFMASVTGHHKEMAILLRYGAVFIIGVGAQLYLVNGICAGELFPTCIRNLAYSFGQFHTRIGVVLAPQIFFLADVWTSLPYLAMFLLVIADMIFFQLNIKETKNNPLSDHMPGEEESWFGRKKRNRAAAAQLLRSDLEANEKANP